MKHRVVVSVTKYYSATGQTAADAVAQAIQNAERDLDQGFGAFDTRKPPKIIGHYFEQDLKDLPR